MAERAGCLEEEQEQKTTTLPPGLSKACPQLLFLSPMQSVPRPVQGSATLWPLGRT